MSIEDGGPAFPRPASSQPNISIGTEGMVFKPAADGVTVRDYFAAKALQGILVNGGCYGHIDGQGDDKRLSELAYVYSDAMMAARKAGA